MIEEAEPLRNILNDYAELYDQKWQFMRAKKLGLNTYNAVTDHALNTELHEVLQLVETDMTIFYRKLADVDCENLQLSDAELLAPLMDAYYAPDALSAADKTRTCNWLRQYQQRVVVDSTSNLIRRQRMNNINPKYVLRNYMAQLAIDKAELGDFSLVNELLELLRQPYAEQADMAHFAVKRPDWARDRAGCSMLSCSS